MTAYEYAKAYYEIGYKFRHTSGATGEQCKRFWDLSDRWLALAGYATASFWHIQGAEDIRIIDMVRP